MVNEDIVYGLKIALSKGETLKDAMMSFYNSGYSKFEIEEAARALNRIGLPQAMPKIQEDPLSQKNKSKIPKKNPFLFQKQAEIDQLNPQNVSQSQQIQTEQMGKNLGPSPQSAYQDNQQSSRQQIQTNQNINIQPNKDIQFSQTNQVSAAQFNPNQKQEGYKIKTREVKMKPLKQVNPKSFEAPKPKSPQFVSGYGGHGRHPISNVVLTFLVIILIVLIALLVSLFIYKDALIDLIRGWFGL